MRKMALSGSLSYSGAKSWRLRFSASTSRRIGSLTFSSKSALRGRNHSRLLFRASPRKNCGASGGKPGKGEGKVASVREVSHIPDAAPARVVRFVIAQLWRSGTRRVDEGGCG